MEAQANYHMRVSNAHPKMRDFYVTPKAGDCSPSFAADRRLSDAGRRIYETAVL